MNNDNDSYIELKLLSIFSIACVGSGQMFLPIFYKQVLGLGNDKIGFISSITPFVSFIAFPYWTTLIDKTHAYKRIMITNMLIALICILSIGAVPYLSDEDWIRILLISICCFGYAFFGFPVIAALVDTVILKALANRKDLYGRQKIGVPIGFAISVFLTGLLMEKLDTPYALFIVFATSNILFVLTVWYMDFEDKDDKQVIFVNDNNDVKSVTEYGATSSNGSSSIVVEDEHEVDDETVNFLKDIENDDRMTVSMWHLLKDPEACQFFYSMILVGCSIAVVLAFLYLFIETDLHGSPTLIGLLGPLGSSTELVCFFFSKEIFHRLGSTRMLVLAQLILIYRCITYILCTGLPTYGFHWAVATQLLHGAGFSITWSAAALKADEIAPAHLKSSAQGLFNMAFSGLGSGLGALIGGYIYEKWGARAMWAFTALIGIISIFMYTSLFVRRVLFLPISNLIKKYK